MDYELMMNGNVKIGQKAPDFHAITTFGEISLEDYKGKWLVLFSHPGDFTPVCTTEMMTFTRAHTYFKQLNTDLLGLSVDSNPSHLAWVYDIYCRTGIKVSFPIIADRNGEIARKYGMISNDISNTETVRNVFIIDDKGVIRTILVYPMNVGRFIPEIIRIVQALQMADCMNSSTAASTIFIKYPSLAYFIALEDACNITGDLLSAAASTIACIISILFTLNAPIANPSFIDFSNISFVVTNILSFLSFYYFAMVILFLFFSYVKKKEKKIYIFSFFLNLLFIFFINIT